MLPYSSPKTVLNDGIRKLYPCIKQQVQIIQFRIISSEHPPIHVLSCISKSEGDTSKERSGPHRNQGEFHPWHQ